MAMNPPITPGEILLQDYLLPMGISQNAMARAIGVSPRAINEIVLGKRAITPAMSILRTLLRDGYDGKAGRRVTFLHFARSAEDQIFADELAQIAAADNDVDVVLRHGSVFSEFELRRLVRTV